MTCIKEKEENALITLEEEEAIENAFESAPLDRAEKLFIWISVIWGMTILGFIVFLFT